MKRGVRCGSIDLLPAADDDVRWIAACHDREDVWRMFGLDGSARLRILLRHKQGDLEVGVAFRRADQRRVGFTVAYPPRDDMPMWELTMAVPEPEDRDAFSAIAMGDAVLYSLFYERGIDFIGWRTRPDNRAVEAILKRMGYRPIESDESYRIWKIDRPTFDQRRVRIEKRGPIEWV